MQCCSGATSCIHVLQETLPYSNMQHGRAQVWLWGYVLGYTLGNACKAGSVALCSGHALQDSAAMQLHAGLAAFVCSGLMKTQHVLVSAWGHPHGEVRKQLPELFLPCHQGPPCRRAATRQTLQRPSWILVCRTRVAVDHNLAPLASERLLLS